MTVPLVRRFTLALAGASLMLATASPYSTVAGTAQPAMPSDFNGDGFADLAIGVPNESVESQWCGAGAVHVLYGSRLGPTASGDQYWHQDSPGVKGRAKGGNRSCDEEGDEFGSSLASGDFNRDGHADLAIGAPFDRVGKTSMAGAVNVLYGSKRGLSATDGQRLSQASVPGKPESYDRFGANLASGDFNADGYWDLAIAVPGEDLGGVFDAGIVQVVYGGPNGLVVTASTVLTRSMSGSPDFASQAFGLSVVAGDIDGDGRADLAVGAPDVSCTSSLCVTSGGDVTVFYGTPTGLGDRVERWSQDSPGIEDEAESDDQFGSAVAIGDFNADGFGDLAVGAIYEWVGPCIGLYAPGCNPGHGAVSVIYGSADGLTADGNQFWHADVPGVPGALGVVDLFGRSLAAGDFDGDGADDLAIGVPFDGDLRGAVIVLRGSADAGLTADGAQRWTQASPGVPGKRAQDDEFGSSLASADYGRSGRDDLAIGVPGEEVGHVWRAGMVNVLFGRATGLSGRHAQGWSQESPGIKGHAERYDGFGWSLAP